VTGLLEQHQDAIGQLCRRHRVRRLEAFGSSVDPARFHYETSDLDFLVEFLPLAPGEYADSYFDLLESLEQLCGRRVDLVMTSAITNDYFLQAISRQRVVLYAA